VVKVGDAIQMGDLSWSAAGAAAGLKDGPYTLAVRPHHVTPVETAAHTVALSGRVLVTELSGSESSAHFQMEQADWVSLSHGVHPYQIGAAHPFYLDPSACFYFAPDGSLVTEGQS
jgi:glycerol transport system ATP-binding protein